MNPQMSFAFPSPCVVLYRECWCGMFFDEGDSGACLREASPNVTAWWWRYPCRETGNE